MKAVITFSCRSCKAVIDSPISFDTFDFDEKLIARSGAKDPAQVFLLGRVDTRTQITHECSVGKWGICDPAGAREVGVVESSGVRAIADALSGGPTRNAEAKPTPAIPTNCSFCGKHLKEVAKLIVGPQVYICDECVGLCVDIIAKDAEKGGASE